MPLSENVRRVVTVVDDDGKAVVLLDGDNPHKMVRPSRSSVSRMLWMTDFDDSEIHLKAGDVLIQQGTNHAWVNRGTEACRIAFVLIDAMEP
jgi:hypothetical protein